MTQRASSGSTGAPELERAGAPGDGAAPVANGHLLTRLPRRPREREARHFLVVEARGLPVATRGELPKRERGGLTLGRGGGGGLAEPCSHDPGDLGDCPVHPPCERLWDPAAASAQSPVMRDAPSEQCKPDSAECAFLRSFPGAGSESRRGRGKEGAGGRRESGGGGGGAGGGRHILQKGLASGKGEGRWEGAWAPGPGAGRGEVAVPLVSGPVSGPRPAPPSPCIPAPPGVSSLPGTCVHGSYGPGWSRRGVAGAP